MIRVDAKQSSFLRSFSSRAIARFICPIISEASARISLASLTAAGVITGLGRYQAEDTLADFRTADNRRRSKCPAWSAPAQECSGRSSCRSPCSRRRAVNDRRQPEALAPDQLHSKLPSGGLAGS
jgi:hypothetical protein